MSVRHFRDLRAWQTANRLRIEICRLTDAPPAVNDRRFCDDIRASSRSVCSNISEGFGRYTHAEFARFLTIARGSHGETQDHLIEARDRGFVTASKFDELWKLSSEGMRFVSSLLNYLRTHPTPDVSRLDAPPEND